MSLLGQDADRNAGKSSLSSAKNDVKKSRDEIINDSLSRELLYYKVKDDFYNQALSNQSTLYSIVITIVMTFIAISGGFITFGFVQNRFKKSQEEILNVRNTIFQLFAIINENVQQASSYHFRRMGLDYESQGNVLMAFISYVSAAKSLSDLQIYINALATVPDIPKQLAYAKDIIDEIHIDLAKSYELMNNLKEPFDDGNYKKIIFALNSISTINNQIIKDLCAGIRHNVNILQQSTNPV